MIYISCFEADILNITTYLNLHGIYPENAKEVAELYNRFCTDCYFANWLIIGDEILKEFCDWIKKNCETELID